MVRGAAGLLLGTEQSPPENSCRPSVDVLFRSVDAAYGGNVLAVVLTGMGQDGLRGCKELESGAHIVVQDEASSVVWGMPGFIAREQIADRVLPLQEIGPEITRKVGVFRHSTRSREKSVSVATTIEAAEYAYLQAFMRERSAIVLDPGKEYLVESRLMPLVYTEGLRRLANCWCACARESPNRCGARFWTR